MGRSIGMKTAFLLLLAVGLSAQTADKQMTCEGKWGGDRARSCKIQEFGLGVLGRVSVDAGHNGGVVVKGWTQGKTLVRAKVEAWAPSDSEASLLAGQVQVETASGLLRATGPETRDGQGWAVSWEVFVPQATDLALTAHNGGVRVSDVRGRLTAKTHNGGVHLARVSGEVSGSSHNGGIHVELAEGVSGAVQLTTHNGGIHLGVPRAGGARVHAETNNGGIRSDFAMPETRERRQRSVDFTIGAGGPSVSLKTNNGGVQIRKM